MRISGVFFQIRLSLFFIVLCSSFNTTVYAAANEKLRIIKTPLPVTGRNTFITTEILPSDVLARSLLLRDELDLIRQEVGKPQNTQNKINISKAAPREVFFQALTLFQKADRLAFQFTGSVVNEPETPSVDTIQPTHVWRMVDAALRRVMAVKNYLGIAEKAHEKRQDDKITPTEVFISIVQANRQINIMLDRRFSPSDVFERTTLATNYAARLLSRFSGATRRPKAPTFERRKVPPDVYQRLLEIFLNVRKISHSSGLKMLEVTVPKDEIRVATPSDVYDIASLLVSELSYIHSKCEGLRQLAEVFYPGRKFPSDVFQRAGILEKQITDLLAKIKSHSFWLKDCRK